MSELILVPTPIGNLDDITIRALNILRKADFILAEDTRTSSKLLNHYDITTKLISFHQYNEHAILSKIVGNIKAAQICCLITDAGTPGISDPGFLLVRECLKNDIKVSCLPGATAFVPALVCSGFPCDKFYFEGFLPHKKGRNSRLEELKTLTHTIVLYESPFRLLKTLSQLKDVFGEEREAAVVREISKIHEECKRGKLIELYNYFNANNVKGEIVIIISAYTN